MCLCVDFLIDIHQAPLPAGDRHFQILFLPFRFPSSSSFSLSPPDMAKVSSDGLAWTAKRVHSQFHSFPSSNTDFWNRDTCNFGSYLNLHCFWKHPFFPHSLPIKIVLRLQGSAQVLHPLKKYLPGYFQTLLTESFHFSESNDQVIMY